MGRSKLVVPRTTSHLRATWLHQVPATSVPREAPRVWEESGESGAGVSPPTQQVGAAHKPPFAVAHRHQPQLSERYLGCCPRGSSGDVYLPEAVTRREKKKEKE